MSAALSKLVFACFFFLTIFHFPGWDDAPQMTLLVFGRDGLPPTGGQVPEQVLKTKWRSWRPGYGSAQWSIPCLNLKRVNYIIIGFWTICHCGTEPSSDFCNHSASLNLCQEATISDFPSAFGTILWMISTYLFSPRRSIHFCNFPPKIRSFPSESLVKCMGSVWTCSLGSRTSRTSPFLMHPRSGWEF